MDRYDLQVDDANANRTGPLGRYAPLEEVLALGVGARAPAAGAMPMASTAPVDPLARDKAEKIKNEGNELMGRGEIHGAIQKYVG